MATSELLLLLNRLQTARRPEDIFGKRGGSPSSSRQEAKRIFRQLSRVCHPDNNGDDQLSYDAFALLKRWFDDVQAAIGNGTYGQTPTAPTVTIKTKRHTIAVLGDAIASDALADTFVCTIDGEPGILKVAADPSASDLLMAERDVLAKLHTPDKPEGKAFLPLLPCPVESFGYSEGPGPARQAIAFATLPGACTLADVHRAYPRGIDPRDMAWVWRRLLDVLGYAHARGVIHGAMLPTHVLLFPEDHHLVLADWHAATDLGSDPDGHIPLIEGEYADWYPPEVARKETPTPGTDILMSARIMVQLLGGNPVTGTTPASVPRRLQGFLQSCLLTNPRQRPQNAWQLRVEFTQLIEQLWGPRKFRQFHMPA